MNSDLSLDFLRVVEQAAIACAHTMGQGDRHKSDQVAVETMRKVMDTVPIDGTIVIGEGERDEAPMLFIGEKVGMVNAHELSGPRPVSYAHFLAAVSTWSSRRTGPISRNRSGSDGARRCTSSSARERDSILGFRIW